jgi:hypothetical protein
VTAVEIVGSEKTAESGAPGEFRGGRFGFFLFLAVLWVLFYYLWRELPNVRAGSVIVYAAKEELERDGQLFPPSVPASARVIVFGNSKVLSGFVPRLFDAETGLYSFNLGKPDESHVARDLELLARTNQLPRTILLTLPWTTEKTPLLPGDDAIMNTLFPFGKLPRDLALFWLRARERGGLAAFYRFGEQSASQMRRDRGWYFIEGQSHYPGDSLPDNYRLPADRPGVVDDPAFVPEGSEFARLNGLGEQYNLRFCIVPSYHRMGELAPSPLFAASVAARLRQYRRFAVRGPNYLLFPNRYFSDPVHLNPAGARLYTHRLAELTASDAF